MYPFHEHREEFFPSTDLINYVKNVAEEKGHLKHYFQVDEGGL